MSLATSAKREILEPRKQYSTELYGNASAACNSFFLTVALTNYASHQCILKFQ
jgi:hypothetical protein